MKDPSRWIDEGADSFEAKLLLAGRADAMPAASRRRVLAGLGLASLIPGSALAASAKGTAQGGLYFASLGGAAKWVGGGIIGSLALWGGAEAISQSPQSLSAGAEPVRSLLLVAERASEAPKLVVEPLLFDDLEPSSESDELEPGAPRPRESAKASLSDEFAQIDKARQALRGGDADAALTLLDEHRRDFPQAVLRAEATVLRIEALVRKGDRASAERLGERFLARHPKGPYAKRVKSLIGKSEALDTNDVDSRGGSSQPGSSQPGSSHSGSSHSGSSHSGSSHSGSSQPGDSRGVQVP